MRADLDHYPPCPTPYAGFVTRTVPPAPAAPWPRAAL
jgi:hypothetical protein